MRAQNQSHRNEKNRETTEKMGEGRGSVAGSGGGGGGWWWMVMMMLVGGVNAGSG